MTRPSRSSRDPVLKIEWPKVDVEIKLSKKDQKHPCLKDIEPWEGKTVHLFRC